MLRKLLAGADKKRCSSPADRTSKRSGRERKKLLTFMKFSWKKEERCLTAFGSSASTARSTGMG
jgi:hypothetical protein